MAEQNKWEAADLRALIGQSESIRREFKAGRLFDDQKWPDALSKTVSAFANTEGGDLFLGMLENKSAKVRVATGFDGVPDRLGTEALQQTIEGKLSPSLPGIRLHRISLPELPDRVVYVVHVPQGTTAYQASDGRYYGRSEFEVKFLPDHEVRLRMSRGRVARANVFAVVRPLLLGADHELEVRQRHRPALDAITQGRVQPDAEFDAVPSVRMAQYLPDKIAVEFRIKNDGELTIRDPGIEITDCRSARLVNEQLLLGGPLHARQVMAGEAIYPGDERSINAGIGRLDCARGLQLEPGDYTVNWRVFLDNSPPSIGQIDLGPEIQKATQGDRCGTS